MELPSKDKVEELMGGLIADMSTMGSALKEVMDDLREILEDSVILEINESVSEIYHLAETEKSPMEFIAAMFNMVKELGGTLISVIESSAEVILKPLPDLGKTFSDSINKPIDIDVLSELFEIVTFGRQLNLKHLFTLVLAAPTVILFKVITGENPATSLRPLLSGDVFSSSPDVQKHVRNLEIAKIVFDILIHYAFP